ncbi:MAG: hypothetical protein HC800_02920 [Phormidesmis sp. RL_2_1]|nr:hypothetical protein [Phormidesmis sp. RL_2_1]
MRLYLHLVPVFGIVPSLWTLYGERPHQRLPTGKAVTDPVELKVARQATVGQDLNEAAQIQAASRLSVLIGLSCLSAIALLEAGASTQASPAGSLRFLLTSSFVGSGYFLLNLILMFRVAKGQSIRLPGVSSLSRRLP